MINSLYRKPCNITLVDNSDRNCYAGVMTQFDNGIKLFQTKNVSNGIQSYITGHVPVGQNATNNNFWARSTFSLFHFSFFKFYIFTLLCFSAFPGKHIFLAVRAVLARSRIRILWPFWSSGFFSLFLKFLFFLFKKYLIFLGKTMGDQTKDTGWFHKVTMIYY